MIDGLVGSEYAELLSESLANQGIDVRLIVPENRPVYQKRSFEILKWSPSKDPKISKLKKIKDYIAYLIKIFRYINQQKVDIIHYQFFRRKSEILFFFLLRALRKNVILTAHNVLPHEHHWSNYWYQRNLFKAATAIIAHSDFIKDKIIRQLHIGKKYIVVIPHGSYNQFAKYSSITREQARKNLGLEKNDNILLFFGYIKPYKGLDLLLDACKIAFEKDSNLKLIIAGGVETSQLKKKYMRKIDELNISNRILTRMEYIPATEVAIYFRAADAVVLPYRHIYHSGVVHSAFAFGRPIIATDVGDFREVSENGASGFIAEHQTPECLAETIIRAFSDITKLRKMGEFCLRLNETKYNWDKIAEKTIEFYKSLQK